MGSGTNMYPAQQMGMFMATPGMPQPQIIVQPGNPQLIQVIYSPNHQTII
jgi:hypothetical protein